MSIDQADTQSGTSRRRFLTYLLASPFLAVGLEFLLDSPSRASIPSLPQIADIEDLGDFLILAGTPTENMLTLTVNPDGTVDFLLPREEVGQGITTAIAMLIAEEMDLPLADVHILLQPGTPSLQFNQLTGGSNTIRSMYTPVRTAAATSAVG